MKTYYEIYRKLLIFIIIFTLIPIKWLAINVPVESFSSYIANIFNIEDQDKRLRIIESRTNWFSNPKRKIAFVRWVISEWLKVKQNTKLVFKWWESRVSVKKAARVNKWVYLRVDVFNHESWQKIIENIINSQINSIVIDVKEYWNLFYDSDIPFANQHLLEKVLIKNIKDNIAKLKIKWIYTIARVAVLKDPKLAYLYPLKSIHGWTFDQDWVDWSKKEVINYHKEIIKELSQIWFDEVQLDYIRFPTEKFFNQQIQDKKTRTQIITNFVKEMYKQSIESKIALSIDTFWITAWYTGSDIKRTGQDIKELINYVDYISPMIYPSHFGEWFWWFHTYGNPYPIISTVNKKLIKSIWANNIGKIRPWLQWFNYKSPTFWVDYIYKQILACKDYWINWYLIWTPNYWYDESMKAAAK